MSTPLLLYDTRIKPEWIDEYDHMNVAHYITVCDQANWAFWALVSGERPMEERDGHEYVIVENHVHYIRELSLGTAVHVSTQLLACDDKRFILFHKVWRTEDNVLCATNEVKSLGFNLKERRIEAFLPEVRQRLDTIAAEHQSLGLPEQASKGIVLKHQ